MLHPRVGSNRLTFIPESELVHDSHRSGSIAIALTVDRKRTELFGPDSFIIFSSLCRFPSIDVRSLVSISIILDHLFSLSIGGLVGVVLILYAPIRVSGIS